MIFAYSITNLFVFNYIDSLVGERVNRNPMAFYIYMGLSPTNPNPGFYSNNIVSKYGNYYEGFKGNFDLVEKQLFVDLKGEYKENYIMLPKIMFNKFKGTWSSDIATLWWLDASINKPKKLLIDREMFNKIGKILSQFYYIIIMIFFMLGVYNCLLNTKKSSYLFLLNLFIVGFTLLLLIGETQGRYKVIVYPFVVVVATYGVDLINKKFNLGGH